MSDTTIDDLRREADLEPDSVKVHYNQGTDLMIRGQVAEAIAPFRTALELVPKFGLVSLNLGNALMHLRRLEEAVETQRRSLEFYPDQPDMHINLAQMLLLSGQYEEGWRELEWRQRQPGHLAENPPPAGPRWDGSPAPRQTLLLHTEQGFGDTIQFLRYVPLVRGRSGARRVILACHPGLHRLVAQSGSCKVDVVAWFSKKGTPLPRFDQYLPLMSLPHALGLPDPADPAVPAPPYLRANPEKILAWRSRVLPTRNLRVGLAWAGSNLHSRDQARSLPVSLLEPLAAIPGVTFHSLQLHRRGMAAPPDALLMSDFTVHLTDFSETAALVNELDLVISVDSAVAHLAGALGKPVWMLLDAASDWRWGVEGDRTPWYASMRLFRQSAFGDWPTVLRRVAAELATLAASHR